MIAPNLAVEIATALDASVQRAAPVSGGDINDAYRVKLDDDRVVFVKTNASPPPRFFAAEAEGLRRLAAARAIRVPDVLAVDDSFLVLEWIERGSSADAVRLGRELADLHRHGTDRPLPPTTHPGQRLLPPTTHPDHHFGLEHDNYVGSVPQDNGRCDSWPEFYATRRLEPLVRRNVDSGRLPSDTMPMLARVVARLDELCGPAEPPALLHGDLWGGNHLSADDGAPVLIDPAVYLGHREIDLAMMRLFGGFSDATFSAYDESHPVADGHRERVRLYQLYPLLVHVTLFGGGYARSFLDGLRSYE